MTAFADLTSRVAPLLVNDIDTDQIIPARFLKSTGKEGLGAHAFADWRFGPDGKPNPAFVLNQEAYVGAKILLTGANFGCGSSREHAPWALIDAGIRVVISESFADIFRGNALKNGLLPVQLDAADYQALVRRLETDPRLELSVSLQSQRVLLPDGSEFAFPIDPFSKHCLLQGIDELGVLMGFEDQITAFEKKHETERA